MSAGAGPVAAEGGLLPPLFAGWMSGLLPGPLPTEERATCDSCAMLRPAAAPAPVGRDPEIFFSPETKCCTYLPDLANFLVGRVLSDPDPAAAVGRATVEERIEARVGVNPLGLAQPTKYTLLYQSGPTGFGRAASMRCPHYLAEEGGRCGVWRHRESTCATWFCKHERGEVARVFWRRMHDLLRAAEGALAVHCLLELGIDEEWLRALYPSDAATASRRAGLSAADLDGRSDPAAYAACWGPWAGRERELFVRCAAIVPPDWATIARVGGAPLALHAKLVLDAYRQLQEGAASLPPRLGHRRLKIVYVSPATVEVTTYSAFDPLRVPKRLIDALPFFDGRPTQEALDAVEAEHKVRLTPGLVRKLVDFAVLAPVPEPAAARDDS